jgi:hypothetical protein
MKVLKILLLAAALILTNISVGETNENEMIQARKDLSSMGLKYNDKEAFIKSLKSRDKIAFKLFIKADGVDVESIFRDHGRHVWAWTAKNGDVEIAKLMVNLFLKAGRLYGESFLREHGKEAFYWAAENGNMEIVKLMVDLFLDDEYPMHVSNAIIYASQNGRTETVDFLADKIKGIKNDKKRRDLERYFDVAFVYAAQSGKADVVRLLLLKGANVNKKSYMDMTALIWAAKNNHPEIVRMLIDSGADNNITDKNGKTALMYAEENGYQEIVRLLKKQ